MVDDVKTNVTAPGVNLFVKTVVSNVTNLKGVNINGLAQCKRDLKESACIECLGHVEGLLDIEYMTNSGCRILYNSCYIRDETYDFLSSESRSTVWMLGLLFQQLWFLFVNKCLLCVDCWFVSRWKMVFSTIS